LRCKQVDKEKANGEETEEGQETQQDHDHNCEENCGIVKCFEASGCGDVAAVAAPKDSGCTG
jgi:hypothetical protein